MRALDPIMVVSIYVVFIITYNLYIYHAERIKIVFNDVKIVRIKNKQIHWSESIRYYFFNIYIYM